MPTSDRPNQGRPIRRGRGLCLDQRRRQDAEHRGTRARRNPKYASGSCQRCEGRESLPLRSMVARSRKVQAQSVEPRFPHSVLQRAAVESSRHVRRVPRQGLTHEAAQALTSRMWIPGASFAVCVTGLSCCQSLKQTLRPRHNHHPRPAAPGKQLHAAGLPDRLMVSIGGFPGVTYAVNLEGDTLTYRVSRPVA